jgi:hypothetical protein
VVNVEKYPFHPGQKLMCQRQNLPINDLGLLSYLALIGHSLHLLSIVLIGFGDCGANVKRETLPQFLASYCISDVCEENFLDSIFVFQKMTAANSSKLDTCQKLWQGAGAEVISRSFR